MNKSKLALNYLKDFKRNGPFKEKKFLTVVTCSNPSNGENQMKQVLYVIKTFIQDEMKAKLMKKIIFSDTLFRFKEKQYDKTMRLAYRIGSALK